MGPSGLIRFCTLIVILSAYQLRRVRSMAILHFFRSLASRAPVIGAVLRDRRLNYGQLMTSNRRINTLLSTSKQLTNGEVGSETTTRLIKLTPRFVAQSASQFNAGLIDGGMDNAKQVEESIVLEETGRPLKIKRLCLCCEKIHPHAHRP